MNFVLDRTTAPALLMNESPNLNQKYELALELFLTMEWKLAAVYEQIGIGK